MDDWRIPDDCRNMVLYPLHKKGDKNNSNNYRGILLFPVEYKILLNTLKQEIEKYLEKQIGE